EISAAGERAAGLTRQLLAFSRKQVLSPRVLDLNALLTDSHRFLRRLIGEDVEIRTSLDQAIGKVRADPGQVEQVIMNLVVNARDAMPEGGSITLSTAAVAAAAVMEREGRAPPPGGYVAMSVRDTGVGMDAAIRAEASSRSTARRPRERYSPFSGRWPTAGRATRIGPSWRDATWGVPSLFWWSRTKNRFAKLPERS